MGPKPKKSSTNTGHVGTQEPVSTGVTTRSMAKEQRNKGAKTTTTGGTQAIKAGGTKPAPRPILKGNSKKRAAASNIWADEPAAKASKSNKGGKNVIPAPEPVREPAAADPKSRHVPTELCSSLKLAAVPSSTVPDAIKSVVEEVAPGVFHFTYKLTELNTFHRLPWCVREEVTEVVVRVAYLKEVGEDGSNFFGFCVHLDGKADKSNHAYCRTNESWKDSMHCGEDENFLTYSLSCELYDFLADPESSITVTSIHKCLNRLITSDPGSSCIVCETPHKVKVWRPATCIKDAKCKNTLKQWPLSVRLSPLLIFPEVLDFLLSCCASAAQQQTLMDQPQMGLNLPTLLPRCPLASKDLAAVIDSFPAISKSTASLACLVGKGKHAHARRELLEWLCTEFNGCLIPAPTGAKVKFGGPTSGQFILMNHAPELYTKFVHKVEGRKEKSGTVAFHGTRAWNTLSILAQKLRSGSNFGGVPYVYYAHQPNFSITYMHGTSLQGWANSKFKNQMIMFGIELSGKSKPKPNWMGHTSDESNVMVRYVFTISATTTAVGGSFYDYFPSSATAPAISLPSRGSVEKTMLKTYRQIHSDALVNPQNKK